MSVKKTTATPENLSLLPLQRHTQVFANSSYSRLEAVSKIDFSGFCNGVFCSGEALSAAHT